MTSGDSILADGNRKRLCCTVVLERVDAVQAGVTGKEEC